jgi:hypothetical protein
VLIAIHLEALRAPIVYRPFAGIPRIYRMLAAPDVAAVAEFPFYTPAAILRNAPYVLNSTTHWKPLVNGYSGFVPPGYVGIADQLRGFPDERSRHQLRAIGVSHVVIHLDAFGARGTAMAAALHDTPWLALTAVDGPIRIYRLASDPPHDPPR